MRVEPPYRVRRSWRQRLPAPVEVVFPLLCPVREADWVEGWEPRVVYSDSGAAEVDCVFVMPGEPHDDVWVVVEHDPAAARVGFVKVTPGELVTRVAIELTPRGGRCEADITYTYTAVGAAGRERVDAMTTAAWESFMREEFGRMLEEWLRRQGWPRD